jgi:uncharacterized protein (DUF488 family)
MALPTVYTVGHSTRPLDELVEMLKQNGVRLLVDVRTAPGSRKNPQFNKDHLSEVLPSQLGLRYLWLGKELGGLRKAVKGSEANAGWDNASFRGKWATCYRLDPAHSALVPTPAGSLLPPYR